jgi:hypothetical protein
MLTGGCYCRAIRYEIHSNPFDTTLCRCATCRKVSAAPAVAWFSVSKGGLRWVQGTPKTFESSPGVLRAFCGDCGTPLAYANAESSDVVDVSTSNKLSAVGLVESAMSAKVTTLGAPSRLFDCRAAVLGSHAALQHLKAFAVHLLHEHLD